MNLAADLRVAAKAGCVPAKFTIRTMTSIDELSAYALRPIAFIFRYLRRGRLSHVAILACVLAAVACAVTTQYGVKFLVDTLGGGPDTGRAWSAFALLAFLIAADNLLWRVASWSVRADTD